MGGYPGAFPAPPTQDPMWGYFTAVAGQVRAACCESWIKCIFGSSHVVHVVFVDCFIRMVKVDAEELQRCLTQSGISGTYTRKYRES